MVDLVSSANEKIYLSSPFIKTDIAKLIIDKKKNNIDCKLLTKFSINNAASNALDIEAIKIFQSAGFSQKNIYNLHAKIFIFDNKALVTSANLTNSGLAKNLEYGVLLENEENIEKDYLNYFNNDNYSFIDNQIIAYIENIVNQLSTTEKESLVSIPNNDIFTGNLDYLTNHLSTGNKKTIDCINQIKKEIFTTKDIYQYTDEFSGNTPQNTIRRNLQELRDKTLIDFIEPGIYKKLWK